MYLCGIPLNTVTLAALIVVLGMIVDNSIVERTAAVADSLYRMLRADDRVKSVMSFVGCSSPRFQMSYAPQIAGKNFAQFIVNFRPISSAASMPCGKRPRSVA